MNTGVCIKRIYLEAEMERGDRKPHFNKSLSFFLAYPSFYSLNSMITCPFLTSNSPVMSASWHCRPLFSLFLAANILHRRFVKRNLSTATTTRRPVIIPRLSEMGQKFLTLGGQTE